MLTYVVQIENVLSYQGTDSQRAWEIVNQAEMFARSVTLRVNGCLTYSYEAPVPQDEADEADGEDN